MHAAPTYELSDQDFSFFSRLVYEKCGIHLHDGKKELVRSRLSKRLRELKLNGFGAYLDMLRHDNSDEELVQLLDAISTNLTSFFRERRHFDFLTEEAMAALLRRVRSENRREILIWSAGCSSGEEPYTLAICFTAALAGERDVGVKILATDLSTRVLQTAKSGVYPRAKVGNIGTDILKRCFLKGKGRMSGFVRVHPDIRSCIEFQRLNLMEPFGFSSRFDVIFCRNVMIYFDKPTQEKLVNKYYDALRPEGYFLIGHSESLMGISHRFRYLYPTIYQKA